MVLFVHHTVVVLAALRDRMVLTVPWLWLLVLLLILADNAVILIHLVSHARDYLVPLDRAPEVLLDIAFIKNLLLFLAWPIVNALKCHFLEPELFLD